MQQNRTTIINGAVSHERSLGYWLKPTKEGTFTIPPAKVKIGSKVVSSNAVKIVVSKSPPKTKDQNFLGKIKLSKREVYEGEQVVASYVIYNRYNNLEISAYDLPTHSGFAVEEIELNNNRWDRNLVTLNGKQYQTATIRKEILFPQQYGDLELDNFGVEGHVGRWFSQGQSIDMRSSKARLKVKPLPAGKPEGFSGGVGSFNLEVTVDKTEVKANEAINLTVKVSGSGNLKLLQTPTLEFPSDFEVYDPKVTNRINVRSSGVSGYREYNYLIIPRHPGAYEIPAFTFSYFDPKKEQYVSRDINALQFNIAKGDGSANAGTQFVPQSKENVEILATDIKHIKGSMGPLQTLGTSSFGSLLHITGMATPALLFVLALFGRRRYVEANKDKVAVKNRKASKVASKRLAEAKTHLGGDAKAFYESLFKALYGYIGDKLNLPVANLNKASIEQALQAKHVDAGTIGALISILDRCEMARFAPVNDVPEQQIYDDATNIINQMEGDLK